MPDTETDKKLESVIEIRYLDDSNAVFTEQDGFLSMKATLPDETGALKEQSFERIYLHKAFPFDMPTAFLSVLDKDSKEIGIIRDLTELSAETQKILSGELQRKYYTPFIDRILGIKERYGFSYWRVTLRGGDGKDFYFTVQDTYRSMIKVEGGMVFIVDVDGNRFCIENTEALDRSSYKRIELYL